MTIQTQEMTFVLASTSPRRKELLALSGLTFTVGAAEVDETPLAGENAQTYVARVAESKVRAAVERMQNSAVVIAADTTVVHKGKILGKPADEEEALEMLDALRGKTHQVITSLAVMRSSDDLLLSDQAITDVPMRDYTQEEKQDYVASGDPLDKAGSYAIQHDGFRPVTNLQGCYANVVGLPLCHLVRTMQKLDIVVNVDVPDNCQQHFKYDCPVYERVLK